MVNCATAELVKARTARSLNIITINECEGEDAVDAVAHDVQRLSTVCLCDARAARAWCSGALLEPGALAPRGCPWLRQGVMRRDAQRRRAEVLRVGVGEHASLL